MTFQIQSLSSLYFQIKYPHKNTTKSHSFLLSGSLCLSLVSKSAALARSIPSNKYKTPGTVETAKKAGVALAFRAIQNKDRVGLIVFGSEIQEAIYPTEDFTQFVKALVKIK